MDTPRYYAIHNPRGTIQIKRTVKGINKIVSTLTKPTGFVLKQTFYTGGKLLGTLSHERYVQLTRNAIQVDHYMRIDKTVATGLSPFMMKGVE